MKVGRDGDEPSVLASSSMSVLDKCAVILQEMSLDPASSFLGFFIS